MCRAGSQGTGTIPAGRRSSVLICWGCGCRNSRRVWSRQWSQTGVLLRSSHHAVTDMGAPRVMPRWPHMAAVPFDTLQGGTSCQPGPAHGTKHSDRPLRPPEATVHNLFPAMPHGPTTRISIKNKRFLMVIFSSTETFLKQMQGAALSHDGKDKGNLPSFAEELPQSPLLNCFQEL